MRIGINKILPLLFAAAMMLAGCARHSAEWQRLGVADAVMEERPDSALAILTAIDPAALASPEENARYALLLTQAQDKSYVDETSDSLILIAENYYKNCSDKNMLMLSLFYHGRILMNGGNYPQALILFTKSLGLAEEMAVSFWCGRNAEQISNLYAETYHKNEELTYARKAYDWYAQNKKEPFMSYSLQSLARAYLNNGNYEQAINYALKSLKTAKANNDTVLMNYSQLLLGSAYLSMKNYPEAIICLRDINDEDAKALLCMAYIGNDDLKKAQELRACILENSQDENSLEELTIAYYLEKEKGNFPVAMQLHEELLELNDSLLHQTLSINFGQALADSYDYETRLMKAELSASKRHQITLLLVIIFIVALFVAATIVAIRNLKRKVRVNVERAQSLEDILQVKNTECNAFCQKVEALLLSRFSEINRICQVYYENQAGKNLSKKISDEMEKLVDDFSDNKSNISQLEALVNDNLNDLMADFRKDFPKLKNADYMLFLYTVLGLSISGIVLFLREEKIDAVYSRKSRLKYRIKKSDCKRSQEYLGYLT
ncbi:MAG: hypothetical protein LIP09_04640 [Bacteroidales bacterium]|nr:hypothetical protein [Bacteroidales bacterium]